MNIGRTSFASYFHFDEAAASTGGGGASAPATAPAAAPPSSSAPAAPASTPAPASTQTPTPGSDSNAAASSDPFSGLDGNFDQGDDLDQVILAEPGTDPGSPASPTAPAVAPVPPTAQPAPAAAPSADPAAAQVPAAPTPTSASPRAELDSTIEGFKANQAELSTWAGQNLFKLSDEDAAALVTDAETVIPRLMGKVYTQALAAAGNLMRNFVPQMIEQSIEQQHTSRTRATEAVSEFYQTNSDLNEKDHGALVTQWAKSFRQANPKATRAEAIQFVAKAVRIQAGLAMPAGGPAPAAQVRAAQPFSPARPGGRAPTSTVEVDPYAGLGMDFDEG